VRNQEGTIVMTLITAGRVPTRPPASTPAEAA
jgi:hypothetical protein